MTRTINRDLFRKIHEQITNHPESHDQGSFEGVDYTCGTTRCVAGWANWFTRDPDMPAWTFQANNEQKAARVLGIYERTSRFSSSGIGYIA